jgi:non-specific serine/threonine protein kinase
MPTQTRPPVYRSGEWEIDLARRELRLQGVAAPLGGRSFEIVEVLVQSAGELVSKCDLMNRVWPGASVEENTLQVHISAVRRVLGTDRELLKTVAGRSYRLLGGWTIHEDMNPGPSPPKPATSAESEYRTNFPARRPLVPETSKT